MIQNTSGEVVYDAAGSTPTANDADQPSSRALPILDAFGVDLVLAGHQFRRVDLFNIRAQPIRPPLDCGVIRRQALNLAPDIQEAILFMRRTNGVREALTERQIRSIASEPDWNRQRPRWAEIFVNA